MHRVTTIALFSFSFLGPQRDVEGHHLAEIQAELACAEHALHEDDDDLLQHQDRARPGKDAADAVAARLGTAHQWPHDGRADQSGQSQGKGDEGKAEGKAEGKCKGRGRGRGKCKEQSTDAP